MTDSAPPPSYPPLHALDPALIERARRIRLACFDVDGTLTDGRLHYDHAGNESKAFSVLDGLGLKLLEGNGIHVALITARPSLSAQRRGEDLGLTVQIGVSNKRVAVQALCERHDLSLPQVLFMGDDLPDLPALLAVGLAVAPANAHPWIADRVHWRTQARGGEGAAREVCDTLLAAQGKLAALLERFQA